MSRAAILLCALLAGCSSENGNAKAYRMFLDGCKAPVGAQMTMGYWGNSITFTCTELKPEEKPTKDNHANQ